MVSSHHIALKVGERNYCTYMSQLELIEGVWDFNLKRGHQVDSKDFMSLFHLNHKVQPHANSGHANRWEGMFALPKREKHLRLQITITC